MDYINYFLLYGENLCGGFTVLPYLVIVGPGSFAKDTVFFTLTVTSSNSTGIGFVFDSCLSVLRS